MEFETIQELKAYLNQDHHGRRIKFATKVFHVLNFTKKHPEAINICGAAWCSDEFHFICNTTLIAQFLELRSNSINTNFRDHGFKIDHSNVSQIAHEFPYLTMLKNWKRRSNIAFPFTARLTIQDIEKIPCNSMRSSTDTDKSQSLEQMGISSPDFDLPHTTLILTQPDTAVFMQTSLLFRDMGANRNSLIENATNDWVQSFGMQPYVMKQAFHSLLVSKINNPNDIPQLTTNAMFLLNRLRNDSMIYFHEYLNFVLHYGYINNCIDTILQLSTTSDSSTDVPHFHEWFQPYFDRESSIRVLSEVNRDCWFVSPSSTPLIFNLYYKYNDEFSVTDIVFNPLDSESTYSLEFEERTVAAPNWQTILYSILQLDSKEQLESSRTCKPLIALNATELMKRCVKPNRNKPKSRIGSIQTLLLPLPRRTVQTEL